MKTSSTSLYSKKCRKNSHKIVSFDQLFLTNFAKPCVRVVCMCALVCVCVLIKLRGSAFLLSLEVKERLHRPRILC